MEEKGGRGVLDRRERGVVREGVEEKGDSRGVLDSGEVRMLPCLISTHLKKNHSQIDK